MIALISLTGLPGSLGYLLLFALVGAESTGVPVPGETALIAAGVLAHSGHLHIIPVILVAALGAVVGDNLGYLIGRKGGRRLLEAPGPLARHRRQVLERGDPFFAKHGPTAVLLGRRVAGLRIAAAWLAGINRMRWPVFLFSNALGAIAWSTSVGLLAYYLGHAAEHALKLGGLAGAAVAAVAAVALAGFLLWRRRREDPQPGPVGS